MCREHLVEVQEQRARFEERGLRVIAVGQGTGPEARSYCEKWGVDYPCLGDPGRRGYAALGLTRGNWWTILLRSLVTQPVQTVRKTLEADLEGARLEASDVFQLGGVALVDAQGTLRALHRAESPEDMPSVEEVLAFDWQGAPTVTA